MVSDQTSTYAADKNLMPQHIAIVMDGNGRWAKKRFLPRVAGHVKGVEAIRRTIEGCIVRNIPYLTVFAFSSENWKRPGEEVSFLMNLFLSSLEKETDKLHDNDIRLKVVGDLSRFDVPLQKAITVAEEKTSKNSTPHADGLRQLWRPLGYLAGSETDVFGRAGCKRHDGRTFVVLSCPFLRS